MPNPNMTSIGARRRRDDLVEERPMPYTQQQRRRQTSPPSGSARYGKPEQPKKAKVDKEEPNYEPSGLLAKELNTFKGVELKYR